METQLFRFKDRRPFRFSLFLGISLVIHVGVFAYLLYSFRDTFSEIFLASRTPKVLVDLTDPRDDLFDPNKKVISRYNYSGKGKLSPRSGQHLAGEFNPVTSPESSSLEKPSAQSASKVDERNKQTKVIGSDGGRVIQKGEEEVSRDKRKKNFSPQPRESDQSSDKTEKKRLAVDTEDSLESKFWFDESENLQISVRSHPDAEFSLELANLLKKRFATYVMGGGGLNFYHVKRDRATALATISSSGRITFERMIESSSTQPYMNYLVSRVVDNPGVIKQIPVDLQSNNSNSNKLYFLFNIRFTGEPLRKWWMGFEFFSENAYR